jgi:hypothetical protein
MKNLVEICEMDFTVYEKDSIVYEKDFNLCV